MQDPGDLSNVVDKAIVPTDVDKIYNPIIDSHNSSAFWLQCSLLINLYIYINIFIFNIISST